MQWLRQDAIMIVSASLLDAINELFERCLSVLSPGRVGIRESFLCWHRVAGKTGRFKR
jgi:hypothetical protein